MAVVQSFSRLDTHVSQAKFVSHEIAQQHRVNASQGLYSLENRYRNGAARYPTPEPTSYDAGETA